MSRPGELPTPAPRARSMALPYPAEEQLLFTLSHDPTLAARLLASSLTDTWPGFLRPLFPKAEQPHHNHHRWAHHNHHSGRFPPYDKSSTKPLALSTSLILLGAQHVHRLFLSPDENHVSWEIRIFSSTFTDIIQGCNVHSE